MRRAGRYLGMAFLAALLAAQVLIPTPAHALEIEYACNPGVSSWNLEGAWSDGTVLESRVCLRDNDLGDVSTYSYWRTRRGGTAILSDWNLGGSNGQLVAAVWSFTTTEFYGFKGPEQWNDVFDTSIVKLRNFPACSLVAGQDRYIGRFSGVQANPNGTTNGASGFKEAESKESTNNLLDCGK